MYYLQSRYYDPKICRFINADSYTSTGQGPLGYNMFAYCLNNPINLQDGSGDSAILATLGMMAVGGLVGMASQFISGIVDNAINGAKGTELFQNTGSVGDYVAAFVSGAVGAIPGGGALASIVCNVGAPAIQQGTDYLVSRMNCDSTDDYYWNTGKFVADVAGNFICDAALSQVSMDAPQFIRDIKDDARSAGYKGTRSLNNYLKEQQIFVFNYNQTLDVVTDLAYTVYSGAAQKLLAA